MKKRLLAFLGICVVAASVAYSEPVSAWKCEGSGGGKAVEQGGTVKLSVPTDGSATAVAENIAVKPGGRVHIAFQYTGEGLNSLSPLVVSVHWIDASGADVDEALLAIGFPPLVKIWEFKTNGRSPVAVSDNVTAPARAVQAKVSLRLSRQKEMRGALAAEVSQFGIHDGEAAVTGMETVETGPADAGPLQEAAPGYVYGKNLVENGTLESGTASPLGWKIEGDNRNNSAAWVTGGAFSGRHAFKLNDRGPFVKSWERKEGDPCIHGFAPAGNMASAREEVSARWASEPVAATPGQAYQASAFYWYGARANEDFFQVVNPVRIEFLDAKGKPLAYKTIWDDWFKDPRALQREGWVFVPSRPVVAPPQAVSVRAVVALIHAFYDMDAGVLRQIPAARAPWVLVDNIALFPLPASANLKDADAAYAEAVKQHAVPFVPSSPGHRPNTVEVTPKAELPGGLIVAPQKRTKPLQLTLQLRNLLGDSRKAQIDFEVINVEKKKVCQGTAALKLTPFGNGETALRLPKNLPYGPYELAYSLRMSKEGGAQQRGNARFGLMPPRETSVAERARMDYPFSLWMHNFVHAIGTPKEEILGKLAECAGAGKTWFGPNMLYADQLISIKDPAARKAALEERIAEGKRSIAAWKKYGITPLGSIQATNLLDKEQQAIFGEIVRTYVGALKDDIHFWRHGTEAIHGGAKELDRATVDEGALNGQSGKDYLYWGRKGTVRQYWADYEVAYRAAKEADPTCVFGPQSASDIEGNVLRLFFKVLTKNDLDSFGMNTYISASSIWAPNLRQLADNGVPNLPIYVSEFDVQARTSPFGEDHLEREWAASRTMVEYWASVLYGFPTFFHMEQWGMILDNDTGSLTSQGQVRPQYLATATMTNVFGAGRFIQKYETSAASVYVRQRSVREGYAALAWAKGADVEMDFEVGDAPAQVIDLWGNAREVQPQDGTVTVKLTRNPVYLVAKGEVKPAKCILLETTHGTVDAAHPALLVNVTNQLKKAVSAGELEMISDGPLRITERKRSVNALEPGETRQLRFEVEPVGEAQDHRVNLRARFSVNGKIYEAPAALNFHFARKATEPLAVDAAGKGWEAGDLTQVANRRDQVVGENSPKAWGGPQDLSVKAGCQWDETNLYMRFQVTDDVDMPPPSETGMWNYDVLELLVDTNRSLSRSAQPTMFGLARLPGGPIVKRCDGVLPKGEVPGARIVTQHEGNVTTYEVAIPWKEIQPDFEPQAGKVISLAWGADDNDGGDSGKRTISWFTHVSDKNPAQFGDLILCDPARK